MKPFRILVKVIVTIVATISFCGMMAEADTAALQLLISGSSMAVFYICCRLLMKMHNPKIK